jgi:pyruvate kinase
MTRKAKIIATIGPATSSLQSIRDLVEAGMDVARLNFSHGDHEEHAAQIDLLRQVADETGKPLAILQDLRGPKVRTGKLAEPEKPLFLESGERLALSTEPMLCTKEHVYIDYPALTQDVKPGDRILIDDGRMEVRVEEVDEKIVHTVVVTGGKLESNKGINLPGVHLSAPAITPKDKLDLTFGLERDVDAIAMSFVRRPEDLQELRAIIIENAPKQQQLPIIAKLERPEALEHLDEILEVCDGVMVARGDLGVEVSPERVPSIQKKIIQHANASFRTVITATQMLESMMTNPRPTRAESSDVANAVFDGSDALMLSGETAVGSYPVDSVRTMSRIILDAEEHTSEWGYQLRKEGMVTDDDAIATAHAACLLASDRDVAALAVFTRSGRTAKLVSNVRPAAPILAFTPELKTFHRMSFYWGVIPLLVPMSHSVEEMIEHVREACLASEMVQVGDQVVMVASLPVGAMGPPNFTLLHKIE